MAALMASRAAAPAGEDAVTMSVDSRLAAAASVDPMSDVSRSTAALTLTGARMSPP
jgi:hypothetical protein